VIKSDKMSDEMNGYIVGKAMGVKDNILYMNFTRTGIWDVQEYTNEKFEFPTAERVGSTDLNLTPRGYAEVPEFQETNLFIDIRKIIFGEIYGDTQKAALVDCGDFILVGTLTDEIAGIWFVRKDSSDYKADYNILDAEFPAFGTDHQNPDNPIEVPEKYIWEVLKKKDLSAVQ